MWAVGDLLALLVLCLAGLSGASFVLGRVGNAWRDLTVAVTVLPLGFLLGTFLMVFVANGQKWLGENLAAVPAALRPSAEHLASIRPAASAIGLTLMEAQLVAVVLLTSYGVHTLLRRLAETSRLLKLARRVAAQHHDPNLLKKAKA